VVLVGDNTNKGEKGFLVLNSMLTTFWVEIGACDLAPVLTYPHVILGELGVEQSQVSLLSSGHV
jgi:hypothetical protein